MIQANNPPVPQIAGNRGDVIHGAKRATSYVRTGITVESLAWFVLIIAAIVTRFWNLEYRTLHHDESIHTYYSWFFAIGDIPFSHNPLMHGPFLFHANALVYLLFGDSDATSRFLPALAGVMLVGAPWLLRGQRFLGRWGALAAGFMLLISPSFLYYTRYIRHDPYTCIGAIALCIAVFRYLENPQRRWMILAFFSVAFMLTNHEIVFAIVLAFMLVLAGTLLIGSLRPLVPVVLATAGAGILLVVARRIGNWEPFPDIPWENPTIAQRNAYYQDLLSNPFVLGVLLIGVLFIVGCIWAIRTSFPDAREEGGYLEAIFGDSEPGSLERGVYNALSDPVGLVAGTLMTLFIFFALFTTLFTNLHGIETATFGTDGTLLYWLGQHDVRRGSQPWFYFITESFQYEWLAIFLSVGALVMIGGWLLASIRRQEAVPRLLFGSFLAFWFVFLFAVLSWAGEKMPWLILHILLPGILVGSLLVDEVMLGAIAWYRRNSRRILGHAERTYSVGLMAVLILLAFAWFLAAAYLTYGTYSPDGNTRSVPQWAREEWWYLAAIPLIGLALVGVSMVIGGVRRTAYISVTAFAIVLSVYQVHAGFRMTYLDGDIAIDTLIYNTTTPDVTVMDEDLTELSLLLYGDDSLVIGYDNCVAWPLTWYFRDNPGAYRENTVDFSGTAPLPPVLIGKNEAGRGCTMPDEIPGYTTQGYVLRWHEPESSIYRRFAIAPELEPFLSAWQAETNPHGVGAIAESIWSSMMTQSTVEGEQRLFRLLFYREMPAGINPYRYNLYIRDDLLPLYNEIRYGE
ncbi:MAG TPA: flippase activity-associated protein Agl23 [Thermomicrobiales bacterium]|nr:flippase activity-associated protein Agl23 [Thermomicrobiales bacterium]